MEGRKSRKMALERPTGHVFCPCSKNLCFLPCGEQVEKWAARTNMKGFDSLLGVLVWLKKCNGAYSWHTNLPQDFCNSAFFDDASRAQTPTTCLNYVHYRGPIVSRRKLKVLYFLSLLLTMLWPLGVRSLGSFGGCAWKSSLNLWNAVP